MRGDLGSHPKLLLDFIFLTFAGAELRRAVAPGAHGARYMSDHREVHDAVNPEVGKMILVTGVA